MPLWQARLACMLFFIVPGLAYGLFVSRLPALAEQVNARSDALGLVLLCSGLAAVTGLTAASRVIGWIGVHTVLVAGSFAALGAVCAMALASSVLHLAVLALLCGLGTGFLDVAMNVQGVEVERQYARPSMNLLHAGFNIGSFSGSILGSLFAAAGIGPDLNFPLPSAAILLTLLWATPRLLDPLPAPGACGSAKADEAGRAARPQRRALISAVPWFVVGWGLLAMIAYVVEGVAAEWGSLYMHQGKGAPESVAALAYGAYSVCAVTCRLFADRLRLVLGDARLMFIGALTAFVGLSTVLLSPWWSLTLADYALMGVGLAPIVPLIFSHASSFEGVAVEKATSVLALCAYSGLLLFPPLFGFIAEHAGLGRSISIALALLVVLAAGTFAIMRRSLARAGASRF